MKFRCLFYYFVMLLCNQVYLSLQVEKTNIFDGSSFQYGKSLPKCLYSEGSFDHILKSLLYNQLSTNYSISWNCWLDHDYFFV